MVQLAAKESCTTQMVTSMVASGLMTRQMVRELIRMQTVRGILVIGKMTNSMVRGTRPGPMVPYTKDNILKAKSMAKAS